MRQTWLSAHAETVAQNVIGQILYFGVLWAFGIPMAVIGPLQVVCFFVGYGRSYAIRRVFEWWHHRKAVTVTCTVHGVNKEHLEMMLFGKRESSEP